MFSCALEVETQVSTPEKKMRLHHSYFLYEASMVKDVQLFIRAHHQPWRDLDEAPW